MLISLITDNSISNKFYRKINENGCDKCIKRFYLQLNNLKCNYK